MSEIDDSAQVEDERQAKRHQRIESSDDQAIEDIEKDDLTHAVTAARRGQQHGRAAAWAASTRQWHEGGPRGSAQVGQVILQPLSSTELAI